MNCRARVCWGLALLVVGCGDNDVARSTIRDLLVNTNEDQMVTFDGLMAVAGDHEGLQIAEPAGPAGHTVRLSSGAATGITVTPKPDFHGTFDVTYVVVDGAERIAARATIVVASVNDAPVAVSATRQVRERSVIALEASDIDGDTLTYELVRAPVHGAIVGEPPSVEFVAEVGYFGTDTFSFRVSDGKLTASAELNLQISIGPRPIAFGGEVLGTEDQPVALQLRAVDEDGGSLTYVVTQPAHGVVGDPPNFTYTPHDNYSGDDEVSFFVSDGTFTSNMAVVRVRIAPVDDTPVGVAQEVTAVEDERRVITLVGTDVETANVVFEPAQPAHGVLEGNGAVWTYTPAANYHGDDRFTFKVFDGALRSEPVEVTIEVAPVDDLPVATALAPSLNEDDSIELTLSGSDVDTTGEVTLELASSPEHGSLVGEPPAVRYVPEPNFHGVDSFSYRATVDGVRSEPALVELEVRPINDPPEVADITVDTLEDEPITFTLPGSDIDDGDVLSFVVDTAGGNGTWSGDGNEKTYTPAANASGTERFTFAVRDQHVEVIGTVTIRIEAVNDPPEAVDDFATTGPATPCTVDVIDNDRDVDSTFTLTAVQAPEHGTVTMDEETGEIVYTPEAGFSGTEHITYTIADAEGLSSDGVVHVGVGVFPPGVPDESLLEIGLVLGTENSTPAISADGRYIAFHSWLPLVPGDANEVGDIFVFDRVTRALERVSVGIGGTDSDNFSAAPHITPDGRYVVFASTSSNLVLGDTNDDWDVFRYDRLTRETVRVSVPHSGLGGLSTVENDVSDNGNFVVFTSNRPGFIEGGTDRVDHIFLRDIAAGTTERITVSPSGDAGNHQSLSPSISGDGRFVAFTSGATNLVSGDSNAAFDIFLRDRELRTTTLVSVDSTGQQGNGQSSHSRISSDGKFVSFGSTARLTADATGSDVFVRDLETSTTARIASTAFWAPLSGDGRYLVREDATGRFAVHDRVSGQSRQLGTKGIAPVLSRNGRYIVWLAVRPTPTHDLLGTLHVTPNPL